MTLARTPDTPVSECCTKDFPSSLSSVAIPTAPPVWEASLAVVTSAISAPKCVCSIGNEHAHMNNSRRTFQIRPWSKRFELTNSHTPSRNDIAGLRNWKTWTQRPTTICTIRLDKCRRERSRKVACTNRKSRSGDAPRVLTSPLISAPSSWATVTALFFFFSEDITPLFDQASSARRCSSSPAKFAFPVTTSPAAKLSRYTCHHAFPSFRLSASRPTIHGGSTDCLLSWSSLRRFPKCRIASETSCIIPTLEAHPIGSTRQDSTETSGLPNSSTPIFLRILKDK